TEPMVPAPDHGEDSYRGHGRLAELRAVITGGDSGIGRAVAIAFAREGADVVLSYLPEEQEDADVTAQYVKDAGRRAVLVPGDLTQLEACRQLADQAASALGGIDILINNAGYQMARSQTLLETDPAQIDRVF